MQTTQTYDQTFKLLFWNIFLCKRYKTVLRFTFLIWVCLIHNAEQNAKVLSHYSYHRYYLINWILETCRNTQLITLPGFIAISAPLYSLWLKETCALVFTLRKFHVYVVKDSTAVPVVSNPHKSSCWQHFHWSLHTPPLCQAAIAPMLSVTSVLTTGILHPQFGWHWQSGLY